MTTAQAIQEDVTELLLSELSPSPFNPRVVKKDARLLELAESIKLNGVHQPIIVRMVPIEGEVADYEIVAGHRRYAASEIAGRTTIPAIIRTLSDDEAREMQITENLQREDLQPLDEAKAFNEAITFAAGKMLSAQELAARLGKSPVYINRRLTLLDLIGPAQKALSEGLIEVGHALELARLVDAEQERLLYWLGVVEEKDAAAEKDEDDDFEDFEEDEDDEEIVLDEVATVTKRSVLELRRHIADTALRVLGTAPFDPADESLSEAGSCTDCLKRTGASPLLFSDVRGEDICTDRDCYDSKVEAHIARVIAGTPSIVRLSARWGNLPKGAFYQHDVHAIGDGDLCNFAVDAIHIDGHNKGEMIQVCLEKTCKTHAARYSSVPKEADPDKAKAERKHLLAKVKIEKEYRLQLFKECMTKPIDLTPTDEMVRALVSFAIGRFDNTKVDVLGATLGWPKEFFGWQRKSNGALARLMEYSQAELLRIALVGLEAHELTVHENDIDRRNSAGEKPKLGLASVAKLIGVDAVAIRERVDPSAVKACAKPAVKKKAAAKKAVKKAAVKPAAKKAAKKKASR